MRRPSPHRPPWIDGREQKHPLLRIYAWGGRWREWVRPSRWEGGRGKSWREGSESRADIDFDATLGPFFLFFSLKIKNLQRTEVSWLGPHPCNRETFSNFLFIPLGQIQIQNLRTSSSSLFPSFLPSNHPPCPSPSPPPSSSVPYAFQPVPSPPPLPPPTSPSALPSTSPFSRKVQLQSKLARGSRNLPDGGRPRSLKRGRERRRRRRTG